MLSYQHKFHAGNHADVFKHICLIALLEKLNQKAKPYFFLDTHAGEGVYQHQAKANLNTDPFAYSLIKSRSENPRLIEQYLSIIKEYQKASEYPGSPAIALACKRENDIFHFNELSQQMCEALKNFTKGRAHIHYGDAFASLKALIPPMPRRGMVLIDPPYENSEEYEDLAHSVTKAMTKWSNGIIMIWYPLLAKSRDDKHGKQVFVKKAGKSQAMCRDLLNNTSQAILKVEFINRKNEHNAGMYGSGVLIINPPYQIDVQLGEILPVLEKQIAHHKTGESTVEWLRKPE